MEEMDRANDEKWVGRALLNTAASWAVGTIQWEGLSRFYLDKEIGTHVDTLTGIAWLSSPLKDLLFHRFSYLVGWHLIYCSIPRKLIPFLYSTEIPTLLSTLSFNLQKKNNISLVSFFL